MLCGENSCRGKIRNREEVRKLLWWLRQGTAGTQNKLVVVGVVGSGGIMDICESRVTRFASGLDVEGEIREK